MKENTAVYAGSFDPVTNGHLDIIRRARDVFGSVCVLVIPNGGKSPLFTQEERVELLREAAAAEPGVKIESVPGGLLADYLKEHGCRVIVRGLRGARDVEYEFTNAFYNRAFFPEAETVFFAARPETAFVSSSAVREAWRYGADVSAWVPACVCRALERKKNAAAR